MPLHTASPLPRIPLIPQSILKDHGVSCIIDTRFRSAARLLQHLWLRDNAIATGVHVRKGDDGDTIMELGSILDADAARSGRNFLTPAIHAFVRHALKHRSPRFEPNSDTSCESSQSATRATSAAIELLLLEWADRETPS